MIVFDVEIKKAILNKGEEPLPGIEYCAGWKDYANMGIACVCTLDTASHLGQVFTQDTLGDLAVYLHGQCTAGFNTERFDIPLLHEHGVDVSLEAHHDALKMIWVRLGLDPTSFGYHHGRWGLDNVMKSTFGVEYAKSGNGALAGVWWQQGEHARVIGYCMRDCWLEAKLLMHISRGGSVRNQDGNSVHFEAPALVEYKPLSPDSIVQGY